MDALLAARNVDGDALLDEVRRAAGTPNERRMIDAVASHADRVPPAVAVAVAELLVQRGEPQDALRLLEGRESIEGLLLQAEVRASWGELPAALALVERVLARDLDAPGARERQRRWSAQLGEPAAAPDYDGATLARHAPPEGLTVVGEAGRGGAGTVYEAKDRAFGRRVAFKVYHRPAEDRAKLEREARTAVSLAGRGVVRVFDADPERGFIIMEWAKGGALRRAIRQRDRAVLEPVGRWFRPLVEAVGRAHAAGLVHADLKPGNVLLRASDEPVISDFGISAATGSTVVGGTLGYLSPERLEGRPVSPADDVYSIGRILEDALGALGDPPSDGDRWAAIARAALSYRDSRPRDAEELLGLLP